MIVIGLTGSIGMGKSTAARLLREMGVPVHCADEVVHDLLAPGGKAVRTVARLFPESLNAQRHAIDRTILGRIVFGDPAARERLEGVLHPMVRTAQTCFLRQCVRRGKALAVLDIPLLFETDADKRVDYTICVTAPAFIQRQRVLRRPGMTPARLQAILASQMPDADKRGRADFVVQTGGGVAPTRRALAKLIKGLEISKRPR